ncbi:carboxymethylenebutenolidase [Aurantimicrobium minutum]|uniref:dienelactone hydrolase family protein n=1 Tax=Aurantimicrobium minutum TaxID=708131 RepID=UPI0024752C69|nr:dienelactone hydrolase family protein [Aurantimicrobium minutum]MDH6532229.1 carboxymethylenebutenolidase [Aurantimicrobium minutum]
MTPHIVRLSTVEIPLAAGGSIPGLFALPEGEGPFPALVMVHEVFGIDESMTSQVMRMASAGYLVLMPDLYSRGGMRQCLKATFRALVDGTGQAYLDVEAAREFLRARSDCTGKVGVVGFCMGGGFALQLVSRGYDAAAVNYGQAAKDLDAQLVGACPIVASFGGKDLSLRGAGPKLEAALERAGIPHDVKVYPDASHAFMNPTQAGPKALRPFMNTVVGFKPRPEDAADAWQRIETFFAEHLS